MNWIGMPDRQAKQDQDDAGKAEDERHAKPGSNDAAKNRAGHRSDLLSSKQHAEDASLIVRWCIAGQYGVDRRMDGTEEQATRKLHQCEQIQAVRDSLQQHAA